MDKTRKKLNKIALFLPSLTGGGAERVFVTLANSLVEHEIKIDLVLANAFGNYFSMLSNKIQVIDLKASSVILSIPGLIHYLRTEKPDVLLSAVENANTWAIIAKILSGTSIPVIITEHSTWSQVLSNQPALKEKALFQIASSIYPLANKLVAVSNGIQSDLLETFKINPNKLVCIYNPVVPKNLDFLTAAHVAHPWIADKNCPVIISVGRLVKVKDYPTLIQAFSLAKKLTNCRLIILGEGPERNALQTLINQLGLQNDIDLPGFVENPFAWMAKCDLFVLSSLYEGLPTVLIEAMACGTPVVSTNCISGPAEILENGKYGDLIPLGDVNLLAAALVENVNHPKANSKIKERANDFSVNNAADAYIELIKKVINHEE